MEEILGQTRAIDMLQAALGSGRLHHAYIFHGPAGVGKFTTAKAFAKVLLCHDPQRDLAGRVIACEQCVSCRLLAKPPEAGKAAGSDAAAAPATSGGSGASGGGAHPDFVIVTKELARFSDDADVRKRKMMNIPVQVLNQFFIQPVYRVPQLRHNKVLVIDEAELIEAEGQNLLLKTLEEPPAGMYLILVTASEDRLLPTVRSRCQRIPFLPLPDVEVERWVMPRTRDWSAQNRQWLVAFAAGSPGRAGLALDYALSDWAKGVLPALEQARQGKYPVGVGAQVAELIDGFAERWVKEHDNASKEAANRLAASLMWSLIAQHARRKIAAEAAKVPAGELQVAETALGPWLGVIDALGGAESELAANVNLGLVCDHLVAVMHRSLSAVEMSLFLAWTLAQWAIRIVMVLVILRRRLLPTTALAWLGLVFLQPETGLVLYVMLGSNRLAKRRIRKYRRVVMARRTGDRLAARTHLARQPDVGPIYQRVVLHAERISGMPILGGNAVELIPDYTLAIDRLIGDIDAARHHVHLLYYIFAPDETGQRVSDALVRAVGRGVKCRLLADAAASRNLFGFWGLARKLNQQGVETYPMLPVMPLRRKLARIDLRNHRKLAVIDCRTAYGGSQNVIDADYDYKGCPPAIDLVGRFQGPVVAQLQHVFLEDWEFTTQQELGGAELLPPMHPAGDAYAQVVATGPGPESKALSRVFLAAVSTAQKQIIITTPYMVPDEPLLLALTMAAQRGVDVKIVVPEASDHALVSAAGRAYFEALLESGVHIYLHRRGMLHAKTLTVDDAVSFLGSSNLDMRSFYLNFELNVLLYGSEVTHQLRGAQLMYVGDSRRVDLEAWRLRPRWKQYVDSAAALLSPLL